jgi:hypothetical protein
MEADAARFQYSPLADTRNIRLLDLHSKDAAGIYRGNLREVCLEKAECFDIVGANHGLLITSSVVKDVCTDFCPLRAVQCAFKFHIAFSTKSAA